MTTPDTREKQIGFFESVLDSAEPLISGPHSDETVRRRNLLLVSAGLSLLLALGLITLKEVKLAEFTGLWKGTGASAVLVAAAVTVYVLIDFVSSHFRDSKLYRVRARPRQLRLSVLADQAATRHAEAQDQFDVALAEAQRPDPAIQAKREMIEAEINEYRSRGETVPQETMNQYVELGYVIVASMAPDAVESRVEPIRQAKADLDRTYSEVESLISTFGDIRIASGVHATVEVWLPILISVSALIAAVSSALGLLR